MRAALEVGRERTELAVVDAAGGPPRLLPGGPVDTAPTAVHLALAQVADAADPLVELVVAHPAHWSPRCARDTAARYARPGLGVRCCPDARAVVHEVTARAAPDPAAPGDRGGPGGGGAGGRGPGRTGPAPDRAGADGHPGEAAAGYGRPPGPVAVLRPVPPAAAGTGDGTSDRDPASHRDPAPDRDLSGARDPASLRDPAPGRDPGRAGGPVAWEVTLLAGEADDGAAAGGGRLVVRTGPEPIRPLVQAAAAIGVEPCELTGGLLLAADPLAAAELVETLTDLSGEPPWTPDDPVGLVVLGALRRPGAAAGTPSDRPADPDREAAPGPSRSGRRGTAAARRSGPGHPPGNGLAHRDGPGNGNGRGVGAGGRADPVLPPPPAPRRFRSALSTLAVSALVAVATFLVTPGTPAPADRTASADGAGRGEVTQYGYTARLPDGWRHTGGLPERRRSVLTPAGAPEGSDLIAVERTPLGYDSAAEPDRAYREITERVRSAARSGAPLSEFTLATRIGGRDAIAYRQHLPALGADVDWYVLFERDAQLSVGCQHTARGGPAVARACERVVGSVRLAAPLSPDASAPAF